MARAHTIWLVLSDTDHAPIRAFTVKHELRTWLDKKPDWMKEYWSLWRIPDGATEQAESRFLCRADKAMEAIKW